MSLEGRQRLKSWNDNEGAVGWDEVRSTGGLGTLKRKVRYLMCEIGRKKERKRMAVYICVALEQEERKKNCFWSRFCQ